MLYRTMNVAAVIGQDSRAGLLGEDHRKTCSGALFGHEKTAGYSLRREPE